MPSMMLRTWVVKNYVIEQYFCAYTYCFRDRPMSLGPLRVPQKSLVVTIKSVRRKLSSLITRPLNVVNPCQPLREGFESRTMN